MAIRTVPNINISYNIETKDFEINNFRIDFIDVARDLEQRVNPAEGDYNRQASLQARRVGYLLIPSGLSFTEHLNIYSDALEGKVFDPPASLDHHSFNITNKGYYLGELMSTSMVSYAKYKLNIIPVYLNPIVEEIDIINENGTGEYENEHGKALNTIINSEKLRSQIKGYSNNQLSLLVGRSKSALYNNNSSGDTLYGYFYYSNGGNKVSYTDTKVGLANYNRTRELYDIGAILQLPWGSQILFDGYKYYSQPMPGQQNTDEIEKLPSTWKGGRSCCSYISLKDMKNNGTTEYNRHREILSYYYVWTEDGKMPTQDKKSVVFLNQVTVNYGVLPNFYATGAVSGQSLFDRTQGTRAYNTRMFEGNTINFIHDNDIKIGNNQYAIRPNGFKASNLIPIGWSLQEGENSSAFVSKTQRGFPVAKKSFDAMLAALKNKGSNIYEKEKIEVTYKYKDNGDWDADAEIVWSDNDTKLSITINQPWRAGYTDCSYDNFVQTYETSMLKQFQYFNTKGKYNKIDENAGGGISLFFGSVTDIKTYRFTVGSENTMSRTAWYSRCHYYPSNNEYVVTTGRFGFQDVLGSGNSQTMLDWLNSYSGGIYKDYKLAYVGDLQDEDINSAVTEKLKTTSINRGNFISELCSTGLCPYYDYFHFNGYKSHSLPQS